MKKFQLFSIVLFFAALFCLNAGNRELFKAPPRHHIFSSTGEVILKLKKADWIYDCTDCHKDFKTRTDPREMTAEHRELRYDHIKGDNWCFSCHYEALDKRNRIYPAKARDIYRGPQDMVKICSRCHGDKTREWEIGIHGKVVGSWLTYGNVKTEKKTCDNCHSPHHPRSVKVKPFPGPTVRFDRAGNDHE
ncbi:MAG: hypothetical protein GY950_25155 [bacterium]|nr:hypothetical protein [bacterium]